MCFSVYVSTDRVNEKDRNSEIETYKRGERKRECKRLIKYMYAVIYYSYIPRKMTY